MVLMKVVVLAAGYGTRLERDLSAPTNSTHRHLQGTPKPLLPVGGVPLLTRWITHFSQLDPLPEQVVVVVNDLHHNKYVSWQRSLPPHPLDLVLLNEGSHDNDHRSGAVACIKLATDTDPAHHWLVVAGDTLLPPSFSVSALVKQQQQREGEAVSVIISAPVQEQNVSKHGIIEADDDGRVMKLLEKPDPCSTPSRLQSPCVYLLHCQALPFLQEFLESRKDRPLSERDATGHFISELVCRFPVYHVSVKERYDIGGLESYIQCCQAFQVLEKPNIVGSIKSS
ncbi:MobA-like NTP transferase [Trinorchestia longiramus]|nr:MobA-like NTP transferase [Trinorchestia longiramus]